MKLFNLLGITGMLAATILVAVTFLFAYLQPDKSITIHINGISEANLEIMLLVAIFLWGFIVWFTAIGRWIK